MTFEETLRIELIKAYINEYGETAWTSKTEEEKGKTLHELLGSLLAVAARR